MSCLRTSVSASSGRPAASAAVAAVVVDVGDLVRIGQAIEELEAALRPAVGLVEVETDERRSRPRPVGVGQEHRIVESLGQRDRLLRQLGVVLPHRLGDEGLGLRGAAGIRELERAGEPALDQAPRRARRFHSVAPDRRFERELPVELGQRLRLRGQVDRLRHGLPVGFPGPSCRAFTLPISRQMPPSPGERPPRHGAARSDSPRLSPQRQVGRPPEPLERLGLERAPTPSSRSRQASSAISGFTASA